MKILSYNNKRFDRDLERMLNKENSNKSNTVAVSSIIKDVKKNGDYAILKYEKKFNKNNKIIPNQRQISKLIYTLDSKVKKAIDLAYNRILKFHSLKI